MEGERKAHDHPSNPTLVIGLGPFGRAVVDELERDHTAEPALIANGLHIGALGLSTPTGRARSPGAIRNLECVRVAVDPEDEAKFETLRVGGDDDAALALIHAEASSRARWLLDLAHFLKTTQPTDARGPRLDIFVIASLDDEGVAELVTPLVAKLAAELRDEFRPILRRGDGALAVCPVLAAPRAADRKTVRNVVRTLAALGDAEVDKRPQARMYVVEDQSGKYVVSRRELVRSFASFLHLLLFSKLRDQAGVRALVEREDRDPTGPLATFACATLEVDVPALHRLCALKLAREVLREFREGGDPVLTEIAGEAHPLVPDPVAVEEELWRERNVGTLEDHLKPPPLPVPEIHRSDEPEDIVEHKLGALWRANTLRTIHQFRDEVERFNMDRLSTEIERNGAGLVDRLMSDMLARVRHEIGVGPRGHARALEFVRYAHTHATGRADAAASQISSPDLPKFPPPPLDRHLDAVREAVHARARRRPFRMRFFGVLLWFILAASFASLFSALFSVLGWTQFIGWPTWIAGGAFSASSLYYIGWAHLKRHHNWVLETRNALDQALKRYMRQDVVAYFRRRLHYTRLLWVYRVYRRIADALEELVDQLEATRAACAEADRVLESKERELLEELGTSARSGILFRGLLLPETVDAVYAAVKPPEVKSLAERLLAEAVADGDTDALEAPFADPDRLLSFSMEQLKPLDGASPFATGSSNPLSSAVREGVAVFLRQLVMKLSLPLELIEASATNAPVTARLAIVPPQGAPLVETTLGDENLGGGWDVHALSEDPNRIHLVMERGGLEPEALALMSDTDEVART